MMHKFLLAALSACSLSVFAQDDYFQQEVNYTINVSLNDSLHRLTGDIEMIYHNHSPQSLDRIYMHLWPNAYKNSSTALGEQLLNQGDLELYLAEENERGAMRKISFSVNDKTARWEFDSLHPDIAVIYLDQKLDPGASLKISTPFMVDLPDGSISRLGHIGESYMISQWYPKPAVYDRKGWHPIPYLTQGEFYSEYGTFDVYITLPENYTVGATGDLQTASEIKRLDSIAAGTKEGALRALSRFPESSDKMKTLHYHQEKVHDFAWFADKRFAVLKGEVKLPHSGRTVTTWAMFTGNEAHLWEKAPEYIADGTYYYSLWLGDYPYNQVTAVDGTISAGGGMEYPNVTVIGSSGSAKLLEQVIVHEVGHNWFYGILGSNERQHPWMDEGLNSFYENRYFETKYPDARLSEMLPMGPFGNWLDLDKFKHKAYYELSYLFSQRQNEDQPIEYPAADYTSLNYGAIVYSKTALAFEHLMMSLGEEDFDRLMKSYYEKWKFKHPYPEDLRKVFEGSTASTAGGQNFNWFFDTIIPTTLPVDYAVKRVKKEDEGSFRVKVKNSGEASTPFSLSTISGDSVTATFVFPATDKSKWVIIPSGNADKIRLDGKHDMLDVNRKNNTIRTSGILRQVEKIQFKGLGSPENPYRTQIYYFPVVGFNAHDKLMPGIAFYNSILPRKKFEYVLVPMFSTETSGLVGLGQVQYRITPRKGFIREADLRMDAKRFHYSNLPDDLAFLRLMPSLFVKLNNSLTSHNTYSLHFRHKYISEDLIATDGLILRDQDVRFNEIEFTKKNNFVLSPSELRIEAEQGPDYVKLFGEYNLRLPYLKKNKKSFDIRVFGGSFVMNDGASPVYGFSFSGNPDYQYDHILLGRSKISGVTNHQLVPKDAQFKNLTDQLNSTDWISGINLKASTPALPLAVYMDAAVAGYPGQTGHAWDAGVAFILIRDIAEIYFPLAMSADLNQLSYGEKIRFMLNFDLMNPFKLLRSVEF